MKIANWKMQVSLKKLRLFEIFNLTFAFCIEV